MAGILALIAAPSWVGLVNNRRATAVRDEIVQGIRLAQDEAERDRVDRNVTIVTNVQPPTITVDGHATESLGGEGIPANLLTVTTTPPGNTLTLTYNERGTLDAMPDTPTRITVTVGTSRRCVQIENLLGAMRTLDGNACPP